MQILHEIPCQIKQLPLCVQNDVQRYDDQTKSCGSAASCKSKPNDPTSPGLDLLDFDASEGENGILPTSR